MNEGKPSIQCCHEGVTDFDAWPARPFMRVFPWLSLHVSSSYSEPAE